MYLQRLCTRHAASTHEVATTEVVDRLQRDVVIAEQPMAARENAFIDCGRNDLRETGVVGVLGVWLADQPTFKPGGAAQVDQRHAEYRPGPCDDAVAGKFVDGAAARAADGVVRSTSAAPGRRRPKRHWP